MGGWRINLNFNEMSSIRTEREDMRGKLREGGKRGNPYNTVWPKKVGKPEGEKNWWGNPVVLGTKRGRETPKRGK